MISASGAVAHDVWSNVIRKGKDSEHEEVLVGRIAAFMIGAIAIAIAVIGGSDLNVSYMVGLAFAVAASANFPALLLALTWKRFNTTGAVCGVLLGVVSSIGIVLVGPDVRRRPDHQPDPAGDHLGAARLPGLHPRLASLQGREPRSATSRSSMSGRRPASARRRSRQKPSRPPGPQPAREERVPAGRV